ncbi:hypothetical protein M3Y94_00998000 [Aphelenchoides besseyi]|nr:hypothetical protein M3Y94_00998000 [Aphelenchoides besseyi]KAI6221225.1 hypothetical protein M3Y95_01017900 [Aphelenchoides besseyi]
MAKMTNEQMAMLEQTEERLGFLLMMVIVLALVLVLYMLIECGLLAYSIYAQSKARAHKKKQRELESVVVKGSKSKGQKRKKKSGSSSSQVKKKKTRVSSRRSTSGSTSKSISKPRKPKTPKMKTALSFKKTDEQTSKLSTLEESSDLRKSVNSIPTGGKLLFGTSKPMPGQIQLPAVVTVNVHKDSTEGPPSASQSTKPAVEKSESSHKSKPERRSLSEIATEFVTVLTGREYTPSKKNEESKADGQAMKTAVEMPSARETSLGPNGETTLAAQPKNAASPTNSLMIDEKKMVPIVGAPTTADAKGKPELPK